MAKKKKEYKIRILWINILCTISMILGILGIVMFCSMPELRKVPGLLNGSFILGLSIILIVFTISNFIALIWALKGRPKKFQAICKAVCTSSKEDSDMMGFVKIVAILTIILTILMALSFFF